MQSVRWQLVTAVCNAVEGAVVPLGAKFMRNPKRAQDLAQGPRIVFVEDMSDALLQRLGVKDKRRAEFSLGVVSRVTDADADADATHQVAQAAVFAAVIRATPTLQLGPVEEADIVFRVENLDVGGALILGSFAVTYLQERRT